MKKPIAIIAGEPNSISSEIIFKSWKLRNQYIHKPLFVIGSIQLLNLQKKKLKYQIKVKKIDKDFKLSDLKGTGLPVYDVQYNQKRSADKFLELAYVSLMDRCKYVSNDHNKDYFLNTNDAKRILLEIK